MSKQSLRRDMGSGQLCSETHSSVCASGSDTLVSFKLAVILLESKAEDPNITWESWGSWYLSTRLPEVDCETWASSCRWSWPEPVSTLAVLQNSHRLYRISSRFCSSSVCSLSRCSFSLVCRDDRNQKGRRRGHSHGHDREPRVLSTAGRLTSRLISHCSWWIPSSFLFRQRWAATRFLLRRRMSWTNSSWSGVRWLCFKSCWKALRVSTEICSTGNGSWICGGKTSAISCVIPGVKIHLEPGCVRVLQRPLLLFSCWPQRLHPNQDPSRPQS